MSSKPKTKIPESTYKKIEYFDKIFAYAHKKMSEGAGAEQAFWPILPDLDAGVPVSSLDLKLLTPSVTPAAESLSQQIIATWLMGYGFHWENSFNAQPGKSSPQGPMLASASSHNFPAEAQTGFFLARMSANYDASLNPELCNPFPESGRVMSVKEAQFYYTPKGLRNTERIRAFREADALLERYTRKALIPLFMANSASVPDNDLTAMGLRSRKSVKKGPLPAPQISPTLDILAGRDHNIKITVKETSEGGQAKTMVSTPGIKGCRIDWRFVDEAQGESASEDESGWQSIHCSRFKEWIKFSEKDAARIIEIRAAFLNPRFHPGPLSKPVRVVIT